ncbi:MAG: hypothetical protein KGV43_00245 [Arcobacter sp.]|nr:hypothetical protein [Arcobacter sp.]
MVSDGIGIDYADYKTVLAHKGKISGVVKECKADKFFDSLDEDLKVSLKKAKGLIIEFKVNVSQNLFCITDIMGEITDLVSSDAEIIFGTEKSNDLGDGMMSYSLFLTGL